MINLSTTQWSPFSYCVYLLVEIRRCNVFNHRLLHVTSRRRQDAQRPSSQPSLPWSGHGPVMKPVLNPRFCLYVAYNPSVCCSGQRFAILLLYLHSLYGLQIQKILNSPKKINSEACISLSCFLVVVIHTHVTVQEPFCKTLIFFLDIPCSQKCDRLFHISSRIYLTCHRQYNSPDS